MGLLYCGSADKLYSKDNYMSLLTELKNFSKKTRYDYILVWGNGLQYRDEIIDIINGTKDFEVLQIISHTPERIEDLISEIYSYDYAPKVHLVAKTEYLLTVPKESVFIFVKNRDAHESVVGTGEFSHIECSRLKALKENIRNQFNPRINDKRSENHVIHSSDNEYQTDKILKYLGYPDGLNMLTRKSNYILDAPYHLGRFSKFEVRKVSNEDIYCSIWNEEGTGKDILHIDQTPHFKLLSGDASSYIEYKKKHSKYFTDNHTPENLIKLSEKLKYADKEFAGNYIITKEIETDKYLIIDGVHRASVLRSKGVNEFIIAIVR